MVGGRDGDRGLGCYLTVPKLLCLTGLLLLDDLIHVWSPFAFGVNDKVGMMESYKLAK